MDYGEAKFIRTKRLKQQLLIFNSCRRVGYAFQFMKKKDGVYECCECKKTRQESISHCFGWYYHAAWNFRRASAEIYNVAADRGL